MAKNTVPKKQMSRRRSGHRRSHLIGRLAKTVNARSPVKVYSPRLAKKMKRLAQAKKQPLKPAEKEKPLTEKSKEAVKKQL